MTDPTPADPTPFDVVAVGARALARADLQVALDQMLEATARDLDDQGAASLAIFLQDPDQPGLHPVASIGLDEAALGQLATAVLDPDHPIARTVADGRPQFDAAPTRPGGPVYRSHLPLMVSRDGVDVSLGALAVAHDSPLPPEHQRLLTTVADLAAGAVDRARLVSLAAERAEWFERIATTDPLTGLANAKIVGRALEMELARATRQEGEVSVAVFDIDDFRAINESAGRLAGDLVLREVAAVLSGSVRLLDTVGRRGGDEFALVAPGSAGRIIARRIIDRVAALPAIGGRTTSISAGIARFPVDGATADELFAAAERALTEARLRGAGSIAETTPTESATAEPPPA